MTVADTHFSFPLPAVGVWRDLSVDISMFFITVSSCSLMHMVHTMMQNTTTLAGVCTAEKALDVDTSRIGNGLLCSG
jgi:hypothetical protein